MATATPASSGKSFSILGITPNHASNVIFLTQVAFFCLYGGTTVFDTGYAVGYDGGPGQPTGFSDFERLSWHVFVSLFVFVGLGFISVQSQRYSWQAIGYSFAIATTAIQWSILMIGFWQRGDDTRMNDTGGWEPIPLNFEILLNSLYIAAAVLVAYNALAGRVTFTQAYVVAFFQTFFNTAVYLIAIELKVLDAGGALFVHLFGATFGLFASITICNKVSREVVNQPRTHDAGAFGFLGLAVLFVTFPVFNIANLPYFLEKLTVSGSADFTPLAFRQYFNTVMAMISSTAAAFMISKATNNGTKFSIHQIQVPAIAGGVSIAATGYFLRNPYGALLNGAVAGVIATWAQTQVTPLLAKINVHDSTGVLGAHFFGGIIAAISSAIAAARATPSQGFTPIQLNSLIFDGRDPKIQGGFQIGFALVALGFGILAGLFTGAIVNLPLCESRTSSNADDADDFEGLEAGTAIIANPTAKEAHATPAAATA